MELTAISPASLPKGTIVNTYGDGESVSELIKVAYPVIRIYNENKWSRFGRGRDAYRAVHSMLKLSATENRWQSVTVPRAKIIELNWAPERSYSVHEYRYLSYFDAEAWAAFDAMAASLDGQGYDYLQLLDIYLKQWDWLPLPLPKLDLGRERKVCSVACAVCLMAAWRSLRARRVGIAGSDDEMARFFDAIRPLPYKSDEYPYTVEETCPADFAMLKTLYAQPYQSGVMIETL